MLRTWCGALAIGTLTLVAPVHARDVNRDARPSEAGAITDFSAAAAKKAPAPAPRVAPRPAPRVGGGAPRIAGPKGPPRAVGVPKAPPRAVGIPKGPAAPGVRPGAPPPRVAAPGARVAPPIARGNPPRLGGNFRRGPIIIGGRPINWNRGRHYVYWRGARRSFVPLAVITGFTLGAIAYSAAAYVPVDAPYCVGITEDGCELRWTEVPTEDGFLLPQCVAFCPIQ